MKVITQMGMLDINPESVVSIKRTPVMPGSVEYRDLTHCVEFDDRFYSMGDLVVCISESDAEKLSGMSGVDLGGIKDKRDTERLQQIARNGYNRKIIFVPFQKQLILNGRRCSMVLPKQNLIWIR